MKKIFLLVTTLCAVALNGMEVTKSQQCFNELPHFMLHVDINKTIIIESTGKGFGSEEGLAALLATAPEYAHTWGDDSEKMIYSAWVNEKLFPGSDPDLKKKRESAIAQFVETAKEHNHPMLQEITNEFELLVSAIKAQYPRKVFTSFSNLIKYLREKNYSFSVILRTFGKDLNGISKELAQDDLTNFIYGSFNKDTLHINNKALSNPADIILAFEPGKQYAIQDSYDWWKAHKFTEKGGKPFPINIDDKRILSIFFDDNADDQIKQIVHIMPVGKQVSLNGLVSMGRILPVDTRKAILDKSYYINAVENALDKWRGMFCQQEQ